MPDEDAHEVVNRGHGYHHVTGASRGLSMRWSLMLRQFDDALANEATLGLPHCRMRLTFGRSRSRYMISEPYRRIPQVMGRAA